MGEEVRGTGTLDLLGDECSQQILRTAYDKRISAARLSEACDASLATVYRRIERVVNRGLLGEETGVNPDGNYRRTYETRFDRIDVEIDDGDFRAAIRSGDRTADRFTPVWYAMREE